MTEYAAYNAILEPYIGEQLVLGKMYRSPLPDRRQRDDTPSFRVTEFDGRLYWRDWGFQKDREDLVSLVAHLNKWSYTKAEKWLEKQNYPTPEKMLAEPRRRLRPKWRPLNKAGQAVWKSWRISPKNAHFYGVRTATALYSDRKLIYDGRCDPPAFFYTQTTSAPGWQFYCPAPKQFFREAGLFIGYEQLPWVGDMLLLVSGMKDGLAVYEATGIPFLASNGESDIRSYEPLMPQLRHRFQTIAVLLDPDPPGRRAEHDMSYRLCVSPLPFTFVDDRQDLCKLGVSQGTSWLRENIMDGFSKLRT